MNSLFNAQSKFMDRLFRKVDGLVWDVTTGKLGVDSPDGVYTLETVAAVPASGDQAAVPASYGISVNPFDGFGLPIPAFASNTSFEQINEGDLIVGAKGILGWVIAKKVSSLVLLDKEGMNKQYTPPKVAIIGQDGCLVVKSLTGLLGDGATGLQSSLLPLLMMGEGSNLDLEKMIPLMLFTQQGQGSAGTNSLAQMMPMMLMMSALKGDSRQLGNNSIPPLKSMNRQFS
jgi:hypothetical protein